MSEKDMVEVTFSLPKKLLDVLESENFFGWSRQDFFVVAVQRGIGCELTSMPIDESKKIEQRHGFDPGEIKFTETKTLTLT